MTTPARSHGRPWHQWRETRSSILCSAWWEIPNLSRYSFELWNVFVFVSFAPSDVQLLSLADFGEVLVIRITNTLTFSPLLKPSTPIPDLVTFPVTWLKVAPSSWPAVHQSSPSAPQPSPVISAGFKLPIMQRSLIYETSCVEPPPAHLFLFVSFSHIKVD